MVWRNVPSLAMGAAMATTAMESMVATTVVNFILTIIVFR